VCGRPPVIYWASDCGRGCVGRTGGATVGAAFWDLHNTIAACEQQLQALQAVGGDVSRLHFPAQSVVEEGFKRAAQPGVDRGMWGVTELGAVLRVLQQDVAYIPHDV
jgi:hypothetical protein